MDFTFPHIRYIADNGYNHDRHAMYLGGEPEENNSRLTIGKFYRLYTSMYAENPSDDRKRVWVCSDDEGKGKLCRINLKNFGDKSDLRDKKLKDIIN